MMKNLFKVCRACCTPDVTVSYREAHAVVLCAECNADWSASAGVTVEPLSTPVETRVWTPRPTGILKYEPLRTRGGQQS